MAKKDKKADKKDRGAPDPAEVVEAVRERGRGLLDEVASAAQRIRESFDDMRVLEDVRALRAEVDALARRLAALEKRPGGAESAAKPAAPPKPAAKSPAGRAKPAARKPAGRKPAAATRKPAPSAASGGSGTRSAAPTPAARKLAAATPKPADRRPAAATPKPAARRPAGS